MQKRQVRLAPAGVVVYVNGRTAVFVNLSLTGALVKFEEALPVGRQVNFVLSRGMVNVELLATVARNQQLPNGTGWHVAVQFVDVSGEAKKAIPRLLGSQPGSFRSPSA